jgi:hypothetical protein
MIVASQHPMGRLSRRSRTTPRNPRTNLFTMQSVFGDADGVCDAVGVEYVSRVPRPPLDGLIDDLY